MYLEVIIEYPFPHFQQNFPKQIYLFRKVLAKIKKIKNSTFKSRLRKQWSPEETFLKCLMVGTI